MDWYENLLMLNVTNRIAPWYCFPRKLGSLRVCSVLVVAYREMMVRREEVKISPRTPLSVVISLMRLVSGNDRCDYTLTEALSLFIACFSKA